MLIEAGRVSSTFDAGAFAASLGKPVVSVVTRVDRSVPPRHQVRLAADLAAPILDLPGDHDTPLVDGDAFGTCHRAGRHYDRSCTRGSRSHRFLM